MEIASAFVTIRPEASSFESELVAAIAGIGEQDISVTAETDTTAAVDAVESIPDGEVEVTANTEQAEAALDQVSEKVQEATESTSALGEAATGALGGMGGLGGAAGGAASGLGATAAAGAGAAAGLFAFAQSAIDAESAGQRFELIAGSLADRLSTIDVGGISGDIGDLALQLGSSDEAMLNATASFVTFAESTGASDEQIVQASNDINALALRAVALNPSLGDAGAVADRMTNALARGGRATTQFGIGLTSAEINARAMADTGKQNAAELTQFEKAAAGAAIATERLGESMGTDFAAGSQNARTEWNRMTEALGEASEQVGSTMLPAIENITEAVTELATGIANLDLGSALAGLWDISGPGLFVNGLTDAWNALSGGGPAIEGTGRLIAESLPPALMSSADAADAASAALTDFGQSIDDYLSGLFEVPGAQRDLRQSFAELAAAMVEGTWDDQAVAIEGVVTQHAQLIAAMQTQGATQGELDAATFSSIAALAQMRDQGQITEGQFRQLATAIDGVPRQSVTPTSAPGATQATGEVKGLGEAVRKTPTAHDIRMAVIVERTQFDRLVRDLDAADNRRFAMQVSATRTEAESIPLAAIGAGVGRSSVASIAPAPLQPVQVVLDGQVVAEASFEHNRRLAMAEGYEQP